MSHLQFRTIDRPGDKQSDAGEDQGNVVNGPDMTPGYMTSEFWLSLGSMGVNILVVLAAVGFMSATDVDKLTAAMTAILGSVQVLVVNGAVLWRYIQSRAETKKAVLQFRVMHLQHMLGMQAMQVDHTYKMQQTKLGMSAGDHVDRPTLQTTPLPGDKR